MGSEGTLGKFSCSMFASTTTLSIYITQTPCTLGHITSATVTLHALPESVAAAVVGFPTVQVSSLKHLTR